MNHNETVPNAAQQNGGAERMNHMQMDLVKAIIYHMEPGKLFSVESLQTAVRTKHRSSSRCFGCIFTHHLLWDQTVPFFKDLGVFGYHWCVVTPAQSCKKLDSECREAIFLG